MASTTTSTVWIGSVHATIRVASGSDGPQALALPKRAAEHSEFLIHCPNELTTTDEQYSVGTVRVALEVVETSSRAIALYVSLGFEHEGRLRARRRHGDIYLDTHAMARVRLPSSS